MSKRAIGYIRVSSVGGRSGPGYHTLEIQRASIERTAAFHQYDLIDVLTDEDASSKTKNRPQFNVVRERLVAGEADAVIVWKVSRFSRSWRQAAEDVELLLDNGKDLLSEEGFDTKTAGGRLLLRILFSMAEWEHDVLGEHWETIKDKAVRDRGSWLGKPPLGYRSGAGGVLEPDEHAELVVELFKARANGESWGDLAARYDAGKPRDSGLRRMPVEVRRLITSRLYLGEVHWRDQVNPDAHTAIISPELFAAANRVTDNSRRRQKRDRLRDFPLSGWLRCAGCEMTMGGVTRIESTGTDSSYYVCNRRGGGCPNPQNISAVAAEGWVLGEGDGLHASYRYETLADDHELAAILQELSDTGAALHELASVDARRDLGDDWLPMMRRLRTQKAELESRAIEVERKAGTLEAMVSWHTLPRERKWSELRRIAPLGVLVSPVVKRGHPEMRLAFVTESHGDTEME